MSEKSEILFLLIGNNPLPNYVAARLLSKPLDGFGKSILCLIHSKETEKYALMLQDVLGKDNFHFLFGEVNPWNFSSIKKEVNKGIEAVKELAKNNPSLKFSVGLNYTGGTKAMSVHAYRAIKSLEDDSFTVHYSYLDSNAKVMRFDVEDGSQNIPIQLADAIEPEFEQTKISLDDLLALHGWEKLNQPRSEVRFTTTLKEVLVNNLSYNSIQNYYNKMRKGCIRKFENEFNDINGYKAHEKEKNKSKFEVFLKTKQICVKEFQKLQVAIKNDLGDEVIENDKIVLAKLPNTTSAIEVCNFLDSFWLEDYVLQQVKANEIDCKLHDCFSNFEIKLPNKNRPFFEVDVVTMRGYQLFAISCTILSGMESKQKLFEIVHRSKQLGGAESRVGLVCLADSATVENLNEQLKDDHIRVFGRDDLSGLKSKLKRWFEGN